MIKVTAGRAAWALLLAKLLLTPAASAQTFGLVHRFEASNESRSSLILAADGNFYGITYRDGPSGAGTVFRMTSGGLLVTLHNFAYADGAAPYGALLQASDGSFYGTASLGGTSNLGTVFRMDASGTVTNFHSFSGPDGAQPYAALIQASDGSFYGTTKAGGASNKGTVFRMDTLGTLTTLLSFGGPDGAEPHAALVQATDGNFYGTTSLGGDSDRGTVFRMDTSGTMTTLHSFSGPDGALPYAALIQASDGDLYGTASGSGVVFKTTLSGTFSTVHIFSNAFARPSGLIQASDGNFYGITAGYSDLIETVDGTVFRMTPAGSVTTLHTFTEFGGVRQGGLIQAPDGAFYGTWFYGGWASITPDGNGFVFRMDMAGGFLNLHQFAVTNPADPYAPPIQAADGLFYGVTAHGGTNRKGAAYRMDGHGRIVTLHSFAISEGLWPDAPLVQASDGDFYGMTTGGGTHLAGTVFRMDASGTVTALHIFNETDGSGSSAALIQATDGNLYGTTSSGGALGSGSVFRIDLSGNFTSLHSFGVIGGGGQPLGSLIQATDGFFYGTTHDGGDNTLGTVYRMDANGDVTTIYSFNGTDGAYPSAALMEASDGNLYGTASEGGESWGGGMPTFGTVFRVDPSGTVTRLHSFSGTDGFLPRAALVETPDGYLYGTTESGGPDFGGPLVGSGVVFRLDLSGAFELVHSFDEGSDSPQSGLVRSAEGILYGQTTGMDGGALVSLSESNPTVNALAPTSGPASGGAALAILGGGFQAGVSFSVGGMSGTNATILDPTFLYGTTPVLSPGTLNDVSVANPLSAPAGAAATLYGAYFADFLDVPSWEIFHDFIETIFRHGVTAGCGSGYYCRDAAALRKQMAVFVLKAKEGSSYAPPPAVGIFTDVPASDPFAPWIEELYHRGIVAGCGPEPTYCPDAAVLRQQTAVFLLKALLGSGYQPPACVHFFADVPCSNPFAPWIEDILRRGIATGCGNGNYCPTSSTTRGQMAAFLVRTFGL